MTGQDFERQLLIDADTAQDLAAAREITSIEKRCTNLKINL